MSLINEFSRVPNFLTMDESGSATLHGNLVVTEGISSLGGLTGSYAVDIPGLITSSAQVVSSLPSGLISGSSQLPSGLVSGSTQLTGLNSYTSSLKTAIELTGSTVSFLGNIVVYGTQSIINSENLAVTDTMIYLNEGSQVTNPDLGLAGNYNDGTYKHSGIFRDASDGGAWKVFEGYTPEPSGTINTEHASFQLADFKADVITGTSFSGQVLATNGIVSGSAQVKNLLPNGTISESIQMTGLGFANTNYSNDFIGTQIISGSLILSPDTPSNIVFANNKIKIGSSATATGTDTVAIGYAAVATGNNSIAIGYNPKTEHPDTSAASNQAIAIGYNSKAGGDNSIVIGYTAKTYSPNSINIGDVFFSTGSFGTSKAWVSGSMGIGATPTGKFHVVLPAFTNEDTDSQQAIFGSGTAGYGVRIGYSESGNSGYIYSLKPGVAWGDIKFAGKDLIFCAGGSTERLIVDSVGTVRPAANGTQDLGTASYRWSTIYTSDLSLNNGIGDWTIVEGEDDLFLYNNKKNKVYKFALTEVDPKDATPKKS